MGRKPTGNPNGRPSKVAKIDPAEFEKLCALQCTLAECAGWFDCSEDTIEKFCKKQYGTTFTDIFHQKRGKGLISLRRKQFQLAEKSAAMAIFLGKNYLGQRDVIEHENTDALDRLDEILKGVRDNAAAVQQPSDGVHSEG